MTDEQYYNYKNMDDFIKRSLIKMPSLTWLRYFSEIVNVATSLFSYNNLPSELKNVQIENNICFRNCLCLYRIKGLNNELHLCQYTINSYDVDMLPDSVNIISLSGVTLETNVSYSSIVVVRDNKLDIPPILNIRNYIDILIDIEKTLQTNIILLRLPMFFTGSKNQVNSFVSIIKKAINCDPFAVTDKSIVDGIHSADIKIQYSPLEIYDLLDKYQQKALADIGIYGANKKRERLITSEVLSENDFVDNIYESKRKCREIFVKECNNKFGTNIELVESYVVQQKQDAELEGFKAEKIAEGESVGDSDVNT